MDGPRTLVEHFSAIADPRIDRAKRHVLIDVIVVAIIGTICGADGWEDIEMIATEKEDWLRSFLRLPNGIPSHDTIARTFARISPQAFNSCFVAWTNDVANLTAGEVVAIDGKTLRRSFDRAADKAAIHMVSAWASGNGLVLGQLKVDAKTNEITAIPKLLDLLSISGCIVTIDAMGCQKAIATKVLEKDADYVLGLKANQNDTLDAVKFYFDTCTPAQDSTRQTTDGGHGRIEVRNYRVADAVLVSGLAEWPGCRSIVEVHCQREQQGQTTVETRYYLSSLAPDAKTLAHAIRSHWSIENSLHWVLDVEFDEDRNRIRTASAPENLAVLRHLAINLLRKEKTFRGGTGKKRLKCCLSNQYLEKVLAGAV